MGLAENLRDDFQRIESETRKAAIYCSLSRAWMSVPNGVAKWTHSNCGDALPFIQDGLNMAFVATLAATYQDKKGSVTIPNLMKRLSGEPGAVYALAKARDALQNEVNSHLELAARAFDTIKHLKSYQSLKKLRDEVVAHHTPDPEKPRATHGPLNRLMVRTVRLVDHIAVAINGRRTATGTWVRKLRQQGVAFWSYGMDAFVTDFEARDPLCAADAVRALKMSETEACSFCRKVAPLQNSHVLPAFAYRWLRGRSGTGHIRHTDNPNRRVQDGLKLKWLCDDCEALFGIFETAFATKVFYPWQEGKHRVVYEDWLIKFCVSVSWRVLKYLRQLNSGHRYTADQLKLLHDAECRWRAYLRGEVEHPGKFEQHLLIFDNIESTTVRNLPRNINRFMTGAISFDIVGSQKSLMTFAKLGRFTIFGMIDKGPYVWKGTKVHLRHGELKPGEVVVPGGLLDLFRSKASYVDDAMKRMSPTQLAKIEDHVMHNLDRFCASDQFRSIEADIEMFGLGAVTRK